MGICILIKKIGESGKKIQTEEEKKAMTQEERMSCLIAALIEEDERYQGLTIPGGYEDKKHLLRGLMNVRPPRPVDPEVLTLQDEFLQEELKHKGVVGLEDLKPVEPQIYLWKGDITRLKVGAIVNAANDQMLGCFVPRHHCIDNAIHTFAGMQLRQDCAKLMAEQNGPEPTGQAKMTKAYNLPCQYVLHTVGPIVYHHVTKRDRELLASCYRSCLEVADAHHLESIAFCCISTGVFHFPNDLAAKIAVDTVKQYLKETGSRIEVVFNVFKELDEQIYQSILGSGQNSH